MTAVLGAAPYWRLSGFYLCYFATLGALIPYWGLYLRHQGFNAAEIGELLAALMATKIVAPNVWGWIADHTGRRMRIVRLASLAALIAFVGVLLGSSYWWLVAVMLAFSFFWNASLPQFEAITLSYLGEQAHRYSRIRLWGSVGFIVTVASIGHLLERYEPTVLPWILLGLFAGVWLFSLYVPERLADHSQLPAVSLRRTLGSTPVLALIVACSLLQASHGPYYVFFTLYLEDNGYSRNAIGQLWALGVIAEIIIFLLMHRWLPLIGPRRLLLVSIALAVVRWLLIGGFADNLAVMVFAQLLHAATFGTFHAAAIDLVHRYFSGRLQGRGQALYSSMSFGVGGALGSLSAGYLWEGFAPAWAYYAAAAMALLSLLVAVAWVREPTPATAGRV
ncbi:MAG: MFS transporter [Proteobacteria bacterium]|nr:MAG: MFS transporter [Pseudomonadota bacterium]QKK11975.1 MAG: MFS transporter [Pseudomonadota bacterium]